MTNFSKIGVDKWLCSTLTEIGFKIPTAVQAACIPPALSGKDVMGVAQTGSGKTGAFAIPILNKLVQDPYGISTVVLTPTRELAIQIVQQFDAFTGGFFPLRISLVVGGLSIQDQTTKLMSRPHVVVATPGRLSWVIANSPGIKNCFNKTQFLVLDEADRMIDSQFADDLAIILDAIPQNRQDFYFTATNTEALEETKNSIEDLFYWEQDERLSLPKGLSNEYVLIPAITKESWLICLLNSLDFSTCIVFCSACEISEVVAGLLNHFEMSAVSLHSQLPQRKRMASLDSFRNQKVNVLVTTDVSSRGLDIDSVDLVINFDVPRLAIDYVHRAGRTARIGRVGRCLTLVSQFEIELLKAAEKFIGEEFSPLKEEKEVEGRALKMLDKVSSAKREVKMNMEEYNFGEKKEKEAS
ncbi:hypothetical protein GEMRC1_001821 [Eukaryota sp. GEM-RC1]